MRTKNKSKIGLHKKVFELIDVIFFHLSTLNLSSDKQQELQN